MFGKIKNLGGIFTQGIKGAVKKDFEQMKDDGLLRMYNRVKFIAGSMWNSFLDKIIYLVLKSGMKDIEEIIIRCKRTGENPKDFMPRNLLRRLHKNYF